MLVNTQIKGGCDCEWEREPLDDLSKRNLGKLCALPVVLPKAGRSKGDVE